LRLEKFRINDTNLLNGKIYTRLLQTVTHRLNFTVAKILIKKTPFAPSRVDEEVDWQFNGAGPCLAKRPKRRSMICDSPAMRNAIISSEAGTSRHRTVTAIETTGNYVKELVVGIWQNSRSGGILRREGGPRSRSAMSSCLLEKSKYARSGSLRGCSWGKLGQDVPVFGYWCIPRPGTPL